MGEFLDALDLPLVLLEGVIPPTKLEELLKQDFPENVPSDLEKILLENDLILGPRAPLRWLFKEASVHEMTVMARVVLQMFYLQNKTKGSPLYELLRRERLS